MSDIAPHLALEDVTHRFATGGGVEALSLSVHEGERLAILGPSGAGKSTLLRLVAGFLVPERGRVRLRGRDITRLPPDARDVAIVVQELALPPHFTVRECVAFGLEPRGVSAGDRSSRADAALAAHGLAPLAARRVDALSGGERQRVALLRALMVDPAVLLLDEPLASLDPTTRAAWREAIDALLRAARLTALVVTHDHAEAFALADRVAVLIDGRLAQVDTPARVHAAPASRAVAAVVGGGTPVRGHFDGSRVHVHVAGETLVVEPLVAPRGGAAACTVLLRPDELEVVDGDGAAGWPATVEALHFAGASLHGTLRLGDGTRIAVRHVGGSPTVGAAVRVRPRAGRVCAIADEGH
ncbi:MAG: ABC transporter ATP-binding protein [Gemmatimonadaceae bacterium]|nr:ABC transporter ATP-binding protein [Gemmatimonadaceae bacterium]